MQQWEYCVMIGVQINTQGFGGYYPRLTYLSMSGIERDVDLGSKAAASRPKGWERVSEGGYIAHIIAELGAEGWEMVSAVPQSTSAQGVGAHSIYFRRPVS
jgi:hypothetical protein